MLKNITQFKYIAEGKECLFHFEIDCPLTIARDGVLACLKWIGQVEDAAIAAKQKADAEKAEAEGKKPE